MAQVLIRNLDDETVARLKRSAERAGMSLEAFLRQMLDRETPSRTEAIVEIEALRKTVAPLRPDDPPAEDVIRDMRRVRAGELTGEGA